MGGGADEAGAAARLVMKSYAGRIVHVGEAGAGQTTKMVNQIAIAGVLQGLSEALRFAQASELDLDKVLEAISGGAAQSWQMDNRWKTMAQDSFDRSEEHTSELQSLMRTSYAVFCLKKKK